MMKNSDAVEQALKNVLIKFHEMFLENSHDSTEYIRNVKTVLEATDLSVEDGLEIIQDSAMMKKRLYIFAKALWKENMRLTNELSEEEEEETPEDSEYYDYFFDYIYNNGVYPL